MQNFSALSTLKDYEYRVLAEFVPITFLPDSRAMLEDVERDSGAQIGGLVRAEWAKSPEKRHALQRLAHLKLYFNSAETANYAIRNGLYVAGKKVSIRKMLQEPQRCAKCQRYGHGNNEGAPHFAKDCKWVHDTCGGCGHFHCRSDCTANLATESYCINCGVSGHTVWDRSCPVFVERCKRLNATNKEGDFPYFVTQDSSTWETTLSEPPPETGNRDSWTTVSKRGSSGRGGPRSQPPFRGPAPASGRGRPTGRDGPPATNSNNTALGATNRYRQLTFEETAHRRHSRSASRSATSSQPQPQRSPVAANPERTPAPDIHGSFFDLLSPNSRPKDYVPVPTPSSPHQPQPSTSTSA